MPVRGVGARARVCAFVGVCAINRDLFRSQTWRMWAETVDRGNEWARMSAPPAAAASSPNPTPALAPSDEEDVAICAMMDKYEAGECVGVHTAGPSRTQQPPSPSPCAKQQADKEWLDHEREKENARKRAREFADEVLADAHRAEASRDPGVVPVSRPRIRRVVD